MERTNISALRREFDGTTSKEALKKLVWDIQQEMSESLELLRNEDEPAKRELIHDERYELKQLLHSVRARLTHIVKKEMAGRNG